MLCRKFSSVKFAQGQGGNISVKLDARRMAIKASGVRLSEVNAKSGFSLVDWKCISEVYSGKKATEKDADAAISASIIGGERRPSMEAGFHSFLGTYVVHLHPVHINAIACLKQGKQALREAYGKKFIWCPYAQPGHRLALAVKKAVGGRKECVVMLQNHGIIVSASSAKRCISLADGAETNAEAYIAKKLGRKALFSSARRANAAGKCLFPDAAVFAGAKGECARETMAANSYLLAVSKLLGKPRYLTAAEIGSLRGMDAEKRMDSAR